MFCKVCRDAGCPENKYTSHCVRSGGQVVCPTLLNQACRICKHTGHTSSYCPDRNPRDDRYRREEPRRDDRYQREEPRRDDRYQREEPRTEVRHASIADVRKVDVSKVDLHNVVAWSDEPLEPLFVCDPEEMCREFMAQFEAEEQSQLSW